MQLCEAESGVVVVVGSTYSLPGSIVFGASIFLWLITSTAPLESYRPFSTRALAASVSIWWRKEALPRSSPSNMLPLEKRR